MKNKKKTGEFELVENYFGAKRIKGKRGCGTKGKTPVFGVIKREEKVFVSIVPKCSREEFNNTRKILKSSTIHTDDWKAYGRFIVTGYTHYRVFHNENELCRKNRLLTK